MTWFPRISSEPLRVYGGEKWNYSFNGGWGSHIAGIDHLQVFYTYENEAGNSKMIW